MFSSGTGLNFLEVAPVELQRSLYHVAGLHATSEKSSTKLYPEFDVTVDGNSLDGCLFSELSIP